MARPPSRLKARHTRHPNLRKGAIVAKPEWGTKRICPSCGTRYYDLMHDPVVCPKCSTPFDPEAFLKARRARPAAPVEKELEPQVAATKHIEDRIVPALKGRQSAIVLVDGVDEGLRVVDAYGAEHLEIQTADAAAVADRVKNAGAIFVGPWAPVSLGDYAAGSNHVLPTGGCACHSSGLSVQSFLRGIHIVDYTKDALADVAHHVVTLAEAEDLPAHGAAVKARFGWKVPSK